MASFQLGTTVRSKAGAEGIIDDIDIPGRRAHVHWAHHIDDLNAGRPPESPSWEPVSNLKVIRAFTKGYRQGSLESARRKMHSNAARKPRAKKPKFPASVVVPQWDLDTARRAVEKSSSGIYAPWQTVEKWNRALRDQKFGVFVNFPGMMGLGGALQVQTGAELYRPTGDVALPLVVSTIVGGKTYEVPVSNARLYLLWEPGDPERDALTGQLKPHGYWIVSRIAEDRPDLEGLMQHLKSWERQRLTENSDTMKTNARGIYAAEGLTRGDYVIHYDATPGRRFFYVDRVAGGGTHQRIGPTRGRVTLSEAAVDAQEDIWNRGLRNWTIYVQIDPEESLEWAGDQSHPPTEYELQGLQWRMEGGVKKQTPNPQRRPPPPRRPAAPAPPGPATSALSATSQMVRSYEDRERPFDPERQYPRETKRHHFAVNADLMKNAATIELFHGGHSRIGNIRGQLFCSPDEEVARSHGPVVSRFALDETEILTNYALNYEVSDIETIRNVLTAECAAGADIDRAWEIVVESAGCNGAEERPDIFRTDDPAEAGWEAQRIRGLVAKALGYKAIEMEDEHGTTYLLVGSGDFAVNGFNLRPNASRTPSQQYADYLVQWLMDDDDSLLEVYDMPPDPRTSIRAHLYNNAREGLGMRKSDIGSPSEVVCYVGQSAINMKSVQREIDVQLERLVAKGKRLFSRHQG